jgi:Right handed beta helix region
MIRYVLSLAALSLTFATASPALAGRSCGDRVEGRRRAVPCACGDVLVSSRTLTRKDPIVRRPCPRGGLVVRADGQVTLALGGQTIQGSGQGVGVLVGAGTLSVVGPGSIEGFETGILAHGQSALASVLGIRLAHNKTDGLFAAGAGYTIQANVAEANGRDGFFTGGTGFAADGNVSSGNGRYGFNICGMGAHIGGGVGNTATDNRKGGFFVAGMMHQLVGLTANHNGAHGVFASVMHVLFSGIHADENLGSGLKVMGGGDITVGQSTATGNRGMGIMVMGMAPEDAGGNTGAGNFGLPPVSERASPRSAGGVDDPMIQCQIGRQVCK